VDVSSGFDICVDVASGVCVDAASGFGVFVFILGVFVDVTSDFDFLLVDLAGLADVAGVTGTEGGIVGKGIAVVDRFGGTRLDTGLDAETMPLVVLPRPLVIINVPCLSILCFLDFFCSFPSPSSFLRFFESAIVYMVVIWHIWVDSTDDSEVVLSFRAPQVRVEYKRRCSQLLR